MMGIISLLIMLMFTGTREVQASADIVPPEGSFIVSSKKTTLVPGVVESEITYNTPDGSNPVSLFIVDINLGSSVNIMAASTNYNEIGTQTVRDMAKAAEAKTGRNIVAAINSDLNWNGTGISNGPLIIDGTIYTDIPDTFFGILKNGQAIIGDANKYKQVKSDLQQAVRAGFGYLVKDNKAVATSTELAPRTAVGIKADGSVFFVVVEGRLFPRSVGISLKDLAQIMHSHGAVNAVNMDGGGSTTYLAKREGETSIELRAIPSDGSERPSISSLLVYAESGDGNFHHAAITTEGDIYTPYSEVQFEARGVDSAGGSAQIPADLVWKLVDKKFGSIDSKGKFLSNGTQGIVVVNLEDSSGRKVGEGSVEIRQPDGLSFKSDEFSLGFEETTDFGIRVTYQQRPVIYKAGDIIWEFDNKLGVVVNNLFTSNSDQSVNGIVKATLVNTSISKEFQLIVGKLPIVIFDFENELINAKWEASSVNGAESEISIIHRDSGEPVRFGNQSLRIDFDYTAVPPTKNPSGAYAGFTDRAGLEELGVTFELPGSPKAVGMWIYGTEEAQGLWLRTGVGVEGNTNWKAFDLTKEVDGINWLGWKYVEVDLTQFYGPYTILPGQFIRLMITASSFGKQPLRPVGNIYVDNITVTYGTNPEDFNPPIVESIKVNDVEVVDGQVINTNNITIETAFREVEDKYATGINYENVNIYIDGINYLNKNGYALNITDNKAYLQNVLLTDGTHEIKIVVIDNSGNETAESRYITIDTGSSNKVYIIPSEFAIIGKEYVLELKADEINNLNHVRLALQISSNLKDFEIEFSDAFTGSYEYLRGIRMLNISANRTSGAATDYILRIKFPIDSKLTDNALISYRFTLGEFEYIDDNTTGLFLKSFSALPQTLSVVAPLKITSNIVMVGLDGIFYVTDVLGNPVGNAEIFKVTSTGSKQKLGVTDVSGTFVTREFFNQVVAFTLVAQHGEDISFEFKGQSFASVGDLNGTPYTVNTHGVQNPESSKNITWLSNSLAENTNAIIQYALKADYELYGEAAFIQQNATTVMYAFTGATNINENYVVNVNSVVLSGLKGGKEYVYRVGNGEYWSELRSFKTVYKYSDVDFLVIGDIQTTNFESLKTDLGKISGNGKAYDYGIQVGDLVDNADIFNHWGEVLATFSNSFIGNLDIIHVLGNHEYYGDTEGEKASSIFNLPNRNKNYYSTVYGTVYVATINYGISKAELMEAMEWLVEDANQHNAKWRILVTHQPPYYTNPQGNSDTFRELVPYYAQLAGIDFVFSGHDHAYARTKALLDGKPDNNGIVYIVSGSLGEKRYSLYNNPSFYFEVVEDTFDSAYISISARETTFTINVFDTSGVLIDTYTKTKVTNHEHKYFLEEDRLVCYECHYSREVGTYTGFVRTLDNKIMYLINGEAYKGFLVHGKDKYYFDEETGYAYTGVTEVWELEATFDEDGRFISGGTGFVKRDKYTYYYQEFEMFRGWLELNDEKYYFLITNGQMCTGVVYISGKPYEFLSDGRLIGVAQTGFVVTDEGTYYRNERGVQLYGWQVINGATYYFSTTNGYMKTGRATVGGIVYDFDEDGKLIGKVEPGFIETEEGTYYLNEDYIKLYGWQIIKGATYYFSTVNGYMKTGRVTIGGVLYDFTEDGKLIGRVGPGFVQTDLGIYYIDENGIKLYGWQEINGAKYYFSTVNGYMKTGRVTIGGKLYDFADDGKLIEEVKTGFIDTEEGTYYLNVQGIKLYGWQEINGVTYYFSTVNGYRKAGRVTIGGILYDFAEDGRLIGRVGPGFIETEEGIYYVDEYGIKLYGWQEINGARYYFSTTNGFMKTGRVTIGGVLYDFTQDGKLIGEVQTGFIHIEEGTYYLNAQGNILYGWHEINGATYYFSTINGYMKTGRVTIGGKLYDFTEDGKLIGEVITGFIHTEEGTYYLNAQGNKLYGWQEINGSTYYFSTVNGNMKVGRVTIGGKPYDFTEDGRLIGEVLLGSSDSWNEERVKEEPVIDESLAEEPQKEAETERAVTNEPGTEDPEAEGSIIDEPETEGSLTDESETEESETDESEAEACKTTDSETAEPADESISEAQGSEEPDTEDAVAGDYVA